MKKILKSIFTLAIIAATPQSFANSKSEYCEINFSVHNQFLFDSIEQSTFEPTPAGQDACKLLKKHKAGIVIIGGYNEYPKEDYSINMTFGIHDTHSTLSSVAYAFISSYSSVRPVSSYSIKVNQGAERIDYALPEWINSGAFQKALEEFVKLRKIIKIKK